MKHVMLFALMATSATALHAERVSVDSHVQRSPDAQVAWLDCTFGPVPVRDNDNDIASVRMLIMTVDDRVERVAVLPLGMSRVDVSRLRREGDRMHGVIVIGHHVVNNRGQITTLDSRQPLTLDLTITGDKVTGTFAGKWPKAKSNSEYVDVAGDVTGTHRDATRMKVNDAVPTDAAWPSYVGPNQNFSSGPTSRPIVADLNDARLAWVSQYIGGTESGSHRYGACVGIEPCAGGASPVLADGKLYQFRYHVSEPLYKQLHQQPHIDKALEGERGDRAKRDMEAIGWTMDDMRRRWAIVTDEQLVCIDATTGATLWTATWPRAGLNFFAHKCGLTNHTPVIADGNVYVFGGMGVVRCVDGATGETKWQTAVPGYHETMTKLKDKSIEQRHLAAPTRAYCHGLNAIGGVVIAPDSIGDGGLVGIDGKSGEVLWRVEKSLAKAATPITWSHDGTDYVLGASREGVLTCIEARSGKVAWRSDAIGVNDETIIRVGDILIAQMLDAEPLEKLRDAQADDKWNNVGRVGAWTLTPTGPTPLWQAPLEWGAPTQTPIAAAVDGLVCFRGGRHYHIVRAATGQRIATSELPEQVRWDEGHMIALPGMFIPHPDTQHGHIKMFTYPAQPDAKVGPIWQPPHPHATTYQVAMSHAWADGRLFIRGADAIYCYDLRRAND